MKIILYGAGKNGASILDQLRRHNLHGYVVGFADSLKYLKERVYYGVPLFSLNELVQRYDDDTLIIITVDAPLSYEVADEIEKRGIQRYMFYSYLHGRIVDVVNELVKIDRMCVYSILQRYNYTYSRKVAKDRKKQIDIVWDAVDPSRIRPATGRLREYQLAMVELASEISKEADENDVKLFLANGNLIGYVRHHGRFIPWDDDFDFFIMDKDYEKFCDLLKKNYPLYIYLDHPGKDYWWEEYWDRYFDFCKKAARDAHGQPIIVQDIHCLRVIKYDVKKDYYIIVDIEGLAKYKENYEYKERENRGKELHRKLYSMPLRDPTAIIRKEIEYDLTNQSDDGTKLFISPRFSAYHTRVYSFSDFLNINDVMPLQQVDFEGELFYVPHNCDKVLKTLYGNYRKLPRNAGLYDHGEYNGV